MALWTPSDLTTAPVGWFDANDADTITLNGPNVSAWTNKGSGGGSASQGTASLQPVYNATGFNGKPGLVFDGNNIIPTPLLFSDPTRLYAFVAAQSGVENGGVMFAHRTDATRLIQFTIYGDNQQGSRLQIRGSGGVIQQPIVNHGNLVPFIYEARFDKPSNLHSVAVNAGTPSVNTYDYLGESFAATAQYIGGFNAGAGPTPNFNGRISEIILLTYIPTTDEIQEIQGYLAHKWWGAGAANTLPGGHPYKDIAPTTGPAEITGTGAVSISGPFIAASGTVTAPTGVSGTGSLTGAGAVLSGIGTTVNPALYTLTIISLPESEFPITDLQYRVNAGGWVSLGGATPGAYTIAATPGASVRIRAVSSAGAGAPSDIKIA